MLRWWASQGRDHVVLHLPNFLAANTIKHRSKSLTTIGRSAYDRFDGELEFNDKFRPRIVVPTALGHLAPHH